MAKFAYNNTKNANSGNRSFELNYGYHPRVSYKKDINFCSRLKLVNELSTELREQMIVYRQNLNYA